MPLEPLRAAGCPLRARVLQLKGLALGPLFFLSYHQHLIARDIDKSSRIHLINGMTAGSKHRREKSSAAEGRPIKAVKASQADGLPGFWRLPSELRALIFDMACYLPTRAQDKRLRLDQKTVARLSRTSRHLHSPYNNLLWRHVKIDRPTMLAAVYASLNSNPKNGLHVRSLHVGPLEGLAAGWWPTRFVSPSDVKSEHEKHAELAGIFNKDTTWIHTSLTENEAAMRPKWCPPTAAFAWEDTRKGCVRQAVTRAMRAAADDLGVDPTVAGYKRFAGNLVRTAVISCSDAKLTLCTFCCDGISPPVHAGRTYGSPHAVASRSRLVPYQDEAD